MESNNIENWEKELKNQLDNHQEATDQKDLDAFMNKLDNDVFFEPKGNRAVGKWLIVGGVMISCVAFWMWRGEQLKDQGAEITPVENSKTINVKASESIRETERISNEDYIISNDSAVVADADEMGKSEDVTDNKLVEEEQLAIHKVKENTRVKKEEQPKIETKTVEDVEVPENDTKNVADKIPNKMDDFHEALSNEIAVPVSSVDVIEEESKVAPVSRKRIVFMSTDTTVVTDTTRVKHRKID